MARSYLPKCGKGNFNFKNDAIICSELGCPCRLQIGGECPEGFTELEPEPSAVEMPEMKLKPNLLKDIFGKKEKIEF